MIAIKAMTAITVMIFLIISIQQSYKTYNINMAYIVITKVIIFINFIIAITLSSISKMLAIKFFDKLKHLYFGEDFID